MAAISELVLSKRFVTVVGAGGLGKTTVAIEVAYALLDEFRHDVCFVDLGEVTNPDLVAATTAMTLGLPTQAQDPADCLIAFLHERRVLLLLDGCEHVIEAAARLVERLYRQVEHIHVLATSREAFRVDGERVYPLPPLAGPPIGSEMTAIEKIAFPTVQLFMERAAASGAHLAGGDAALVADICQKLDGNPLAIEIVAGRVAAFGLAGIAKLLQQRFEMQWQGRRTALARHQTLNALLDWSFDLLSEDERTILRRLSIFIGTFTLDDAQAVAGEGRCEEMMVTDIVGSLVEKSLLSTVDPGDGAIRYRLLGMTRTYASKKLAGSSEANLVARRHAAYFSGLLGYSNPNRTLFRCGGVFSQNAPYLGDLRAGLEWCFSEQGDRSLGARLAAGSTAVFAELSLLPECYRWSEQGLAELDDADHGSYIEMYLQETLAISAMLARGNDEEVAAAITRGLEIAIQSEDHPYKLRLLAGRHIFLTRVGDFRGALATAEEWQREAEATPSPITSAVAEWMIGISYHFAGDQAAAQKYYEAGFARSDAKKLDSELFGFSHRVLALVAFARTLWLRGYPYRATEVAREAIGAAVKFERPVNLCVALAYTAPVFLWSRDWEAADGTIARLVEHTERFSLDPWSAVGLGLKGELLVRTGKPLLGEPLLRQAADTMRSKRQNIQVTEFASVLAEALAGTGRPDEGAKLIEDTIARVEAEAERFDLPELLRTNGELLIASGASDRKIEGCLVRSLSCGHRQSALGWELRTATSLARFWAGRSRADEARSLLAGVLDRFTEGFETPDLQDARVLLSKLHRSTNTR